MSVPVCRLVINERGDQMPTPFPQPDLIVDDRRYWLLSTLTRWERLSASGKAPEIVIDPADDVYLTAAAVKKRYGGVSDMWIWRKMKKIAGGNA